MRGTTQRSAAEHSPATAPGQDAGALRPAELAGYYRRPGNDVPLRVVARGEELALVAGGVEQPLRRLSGGRFALGGATEVTFTPAGGGASLALRVGDPARPVYRRAAPVRPEPDALAAYAGSYYSDDLAVDYTFRVEDDRLVLWNRKLGRIPLAPTFTDGFYGANWYFTFRATTRARSQVSP